MGPQASRPSPERDARTVLDGIRTIVQALRESSRSAEMQAGVSGAQLFVLQVLAKESPLSVGELAERTHTHQSSVSVVVQRLSERAFVARKRCPDDGRRWDVELTAEGRRLLSDAPPLAQELLASALRRLSERQRRGLAEGLVALLAEAGLGTPEPPMFFEDSHPRKDNR